MTNGRGADMQESVARVARANGVSDGDVALLVRGHEMAMGPRLVALPDQEHPSFLHPGRTVLVLIRDAGVLDGVVLAAAALVESRRPDLRVDEATLRAGMPAEVADRRAAVPGREQPGLAEALVTADAATRTVALAEHLDHLRHLHMLPDRGDWPELFDEAERIWGPVAERTHPELARRYALWIRTFRRRLRGGSEGG